MGDLWEPIAAAPYNTPVCVKVGEGMTFIAKLVPNASLDSDEKECDQWQAVHEGEHPECWSDGCCWESNAEGSCSLQPRGWRPQ